MSPSMPWTSVTCVITRRPSGMRETCMMRSRAEAICSRMARIGRSKPAISTIVSMRLMASRGLLAWTVVIEPSWPVFMAWSMSSASAPRTSPTMMRSGRIRRAFLTRSRMATVPVPSADGGRLSRFTTWGCCSWSSAESSIVMTRSPSGMKAESTLRLVVLPVPVPPETRMLSFPRTQASITVVRSRVQVPKSMRSLAVYGSLANFRIVSTEPLRASGGMMAFTREPSGRRASTIGEASSTRRPTAATILSITERYWMSSVKESSVGSRRPSRSTQMSS